MSKILSTKKAQAAMEYLINYGWAMLVLAIVIGAIVFTGAFNPSYFVMEECNLGPSFNCYAQLAQDAYDTSKTNVFMNITNAMSYPVNLTNISFTAEDIGIQGITINTVNVGTYLASGDSALVKGIFSGSVRPQKGTVKKINLNLSYYVCAEEVNPACNREDVYLRKANGRIIAQVQ